MGLMALHGGPGYQAQLERAVPLLVGVIDSPDARDADNVYATENAIAAFVKIAW